MLLSYAHGWFWAFCWCFRTTAHWTDVSPCPKPLQMGRYNVGKDELFHVSSGSSGVRHGLLSSFCAVSTYFSGSRDLCASSNKMACHLKPCLFRCNQSRVHSAHASPGVCPPRLHQLGSGGPTPTPKLGWCFSSSYELFGLYL